MANQPPTVASKLVATAALLALLPPIAWLVAMSLPNARQALIAAPERFNIDPIAYWIALTTSVSISICLLLSLAFLALATLAGRIQTDWPMFVALNAIWFYIGVVALIGRLPGLTLLFRTTFTTSNLGWYIVIATGVPIWGPLLLWFFGTAHSASARWSHADG